MLPDRPRRALRDAARRLGLRGGEREDGLLFDVARLRAPYDAGHEAAIRRLCHVVPVSADTALCRVLGCYKMYVDLADEGLSPHLMLDGTWEMATTRALAARVRPGMTVFDVGANLGYFTVLLADLAGARGHVHAAEPNPAILSRLRRTIALNGFSGRVSVHDSPLSATPGEAVVLHVPRGLPQNASLQAGGRDGAAAHALRTTTLDDIAGDGAVDLVKIDAEGAEQAIWQGMARVLSRRAPLAVFVEFTPDRYADPPGFLRDLLSTGFSLSIVADTGEVRPVRPDEVLEGPRHVDRMLILER